jgi:hypothetical protein
MKGCISKDTGGDYFLVTRRGTKVQLANSADVSSHVDQQVKLSGAFVDAEKPDPDPGASSGNSAETGKNHPAREFRVIKVDVLAPTCSAPAAKRK